MTALALLRRFWPHIAAGLVIIALTIALLATRATLADSKAQTAAEKAAHTQTIANYRTASETAQRTAEANAKRVLTEQQRITQEVSRDYQEQLAALRTRADALRVQLGQAAAHSGGTGAGRASEVSRPAGGPDASAAQVGLPAQGWSLEDRIIATEQALQLDALQKWVRAQAAVDMQGTP